MPQHRVMVGLRARLKLVVTLAFVLGTMIPASQQGWANSASKSVLEHSVPSDCEHSDDDPAPPVPCGKVFCGGMALILVPAQGSPTPVSASLVPASDQTGVGLSRFPEPDPPRTISVS